MSSELCCKRLQNSELKYSVASVTTKFKEESHLHNRDSSDTSLLKSAEITEQNSWKSFSFNEWADSTDLAFNFYLLVCATSRFQISMYTNCCLN
jgi:hypothetical protein